MISAAALAWPKRPSTFTHPILGKRQRWRSKCGTFEITRCVQYGGFPFLVLRRVDDTSKLLGRRRTLRAAQELCERS